MPRGRPAKNPKNDRLNRTTEVLKMILEGKSSNTIYEICHSKWGIRKNSVGYYITKAYKILKDQDNDQRQNLISVAMAQVDEIISIAMKKGDLRIALEAQKERSKLAGLYSAEKIQQEVRIIKVDGDEEL